MVGGPFSQIHAKSDWYTMKRELTNFSCNVTTMTIFSYSASVEVLM